MDFLNTLGFEGAQGKRAFWNQIQSSLSGLHGKCYYKHPVYTVKENIEEPDFVIASKEIGILIVNVCEIEDTEVDCILDDGNIVLKTGKSYNPIVELEEHVVGLENILRFEPRLRKAFSKGILRVSAKVLFPFLGHDNLNALFDVDSDLVSLEKISEINENLIRTKWDVVEDIPEEVFKKILHEVQGGKPESEVNSKHDGAKKTGSKGEILNNISKQEKMLDISQERIGLQIAPGPQRIKGLAGSGKSIILAMKAAHFHKIFPDAEIVLTFTTKTLKGFLKKNVSRFYKKWTGKEPNWEKLRVIHSWGGFSDTGLYFEICKYNEIPFLNLRDAKQYTWTDPFGYACAEALKYKDIKPQFDIILMDEAQDFSKSFFNLCYYALNKPKRLVFALDETQILTTDEVLPISELIPDKDFSLEGTYDDEIEKDCTLKICYRNSRQILTFAYAMALGIYSPSGFVQILEEKSEWESVGFDFLSGDLKEGDSVVVQRPNKYSPVHISDEEVIKIKSFQNVDEEIEFVANDIFKMLNEEEVFPHDILVISMATYKDSEKQLLKLQNLLVNNDVAAKIPGMFDSSQSFMQENQVTLSNPRRAKGNEAPIVYVINFNSLEYQMDNPSARNGIFTAITRVKGWCILTGCFEERSNLKREIDTTLKYVKNESKLEFQWPDVKKIKRKMTSYKNKKKKIMQQYSDKAAKELVANLAKDPSLIDKLNPGLKNELLRRLSGEDEK